MSDKSEIQWTDATWNTVYGCTKVSPGCAACYIERTPPYRMKGLKFDRGAIPVQLLDERLTLPLRWKKPRMIFVNSLSDTFHEDVPDAYLLEMWLVMAMSQQHTFQVLTKRPERMRRFVTETLRPYGHPIFAKDFDPLPNVWLGVTVENQRFADERIPLLVETPAAVRFLSCEPLLGPLDLGRWMLGRFDPTSAPDYAKAVEIVKLSGVALLDWVIAGGESAGRPERALVEQTDERGGDNWWWGWRPKPEPLARVRSLRDQCVAAGVPFFFKQWGGPKPKSAGRVVDGREWNEMPQAVSG